MADTPSDARYEDQQADLVAMLKASRELGPEMDRALAESYLQRQQAPATTKPAPAVPSRGWLTERVAIGALLIAAYIAVVIVQPDLWWLIFPLVWGTGMLGWSGHHHGERDHQALREQALRSWALHGRYRDRDMGGEGDDEPRLPRARAQPSAPDGVI